jgi:hypothetical protein
MERFPHITRKAIRRDHPARDADVYDQHFLAGFRCVFWRLLAQQKGSEEGGRNGRVSVWDRGVPRSLLAWADVALPVTYGLVGGSGLGFGYTVP